MNTTVVKPWGFQIAVAGFYLIQIGNDEFCRISDEQNRADRARIKAKLTEAVNYIKGMFRK